MKYPLKCDNISSHKTLYLYKMYFKISVYIMLLYPCFLVSCKLDLSFIKNSFFFIGRTILITSSNFPSLAIKKSVFQSTITG